MDTVVIGIKKMDRMLVYNTYEFCSKDVIESLGTGVTVKIDGLDVFIPMSNITSITTKRK